MDNATERNEQIRKLAELISDIEFAMLTTVEPDGSLRSRPMATLRQDFDGELWFFTRASAPKVEEVEQDQHVCVAFARPDKQHYVSVSGRARLVRDRARIEELWNPAYRAWFPDGTDDPDLALLKVSAEKAEYWDGQSSVVAHLAGLAKAAVTGQSYQGGENEKVNLR
ncbi:MAG TPA: pyridoxamine 5'-phosphate oxidase family protein [Pyrinomonadaceae bacterium]|nr:pyridoxamine 5'-phosphate oxidase family protein [Pyrinomonadaceae bacterium]